MRKISLALLVPVMILTLFGSCQKEKYENVNLVMVLNPAQPTATADEYILSGRIVSSGKIDLADCGFDVEISGSWYRYSVGAVKKAGNVQGTFKINGGTNITDMVFYAIDKYGHSYSSKVNGSTGTVDPVSNPMQLSAPQHTSGGGYENFSTSASNLSGGTYAVVEYGIEYYDPKNDVIPWSHSFIFSSTPNTDPSIEMAYSFSSTNSPFASATDYTYRYYVVVMRLSDGVTGKFYGSQDAFTSQAL